MANANYLATNRISDGDADGLDLFLSRNFDGGRIGGVVIFFDSRSASDCVINSISRVPSITRLINFCASSFFVFAITDGLR